ncbi:MAG: 1-acyl-sn-glycerol-3-phosphate acyltransferase [Polyangia bacterium]
MSEPRATDELLRILGVLREQLPLRDATAIFFPPALGYELLRGFVEDAERSGGDFDPEMPDPSLFEPALELARWLSRNYFSVTVRDASRVPATGPVMLVGNHSAGLMPVDALFAINAIRDAYGPKRAIHPLVHDFAYRAPRIGKHARRMGLLRATRENAAAALAAGRIVMAYPGGDQEAFRPYNERNRVVLAGRKGFVELALKERVPIVPLVSVGLHESFFVLTRGERLARKLDLKSVLRAEVAPLALMLPWGLAPAFVPFLPLPTEIEMRFGEPILLGGDPEDRGAVDEGYRRVESTMQKMMDELAAGRVPLAGR